MQIGIELELPVLENNTPVTLPNVAHTKDNPFEHNGNLIHKDAAMMEMAMRPADTAQGTLEAFRDAIATARSFLTPDQTFGLQCATLYSQAELDRDPYASEVGCSPSMCVWGDSPSVDKFPDDRRYGGIHINFEYEGDEGIIGRLDASLGLYSVLNWEQEDKENVVARRRTYGRAGEYRRKDFGYEYRTLPCSVWSEDIVRSIWRAVTDQIEYDRTEMILHAMDCHGDTCIQDAINNCDADEAAMLIGYIHGVDSEDYRL